jgi:hypothetical protein
MRVKVENYLLTKEEKYIFDFSSENKFTIRSHNVSNRQISMSLLKKLLHIKFKSKNKYYNIKSL